MSSPSKQTYSIKRLKLVTFSHQATKIIGLSDIQLEQKHPSTRVHENARPAVQYCSKEKIISHVEIRIGKVGKINLN